MALFAVKDWEMPKCCAECRFRSWVMAPGGRWHYVCGVTSDNKSLGAWQRMCKKRANFCPLVEAQEVRHGRWTLEKHLELDILICSNCKGDINCNQYGQYYMEHYKYCPNCGAKLIEKEVQE